MSSGLRRILAAIASLTAVATAAFTAVTPAAAAESGAEPEIAIAAQTVDEPGPIVETIAVTLDHLRDSLASPILLDYFDRKGLRQAAESASPPLFFITDAATYSDLMKEGKARAIASMKNPRALDAAHTAGAAFIVRTSDGRFSTLASLAGASLEAASPAAYESYLIGMHEIRRIFGEEPFFGAVRFAGQPAEKVVHDVLAGKVDVGVVEACLLEEMEAKGNISRGALRVVGERQSNDLRCRHSTDLFPGWVLASSKSAPAMTPAERRAAAEIAASLGSVPKLPGAYEWASPTDTEALEALLADARSLHEAPDWKKLAAEYSPYAAAALLAVAALALHSVYVGWLVRRRTAELTASITEREALQKKVDEERERMAALERAGVAGQLSSMVAHELQQPLGAVVNYARGLRIRLARKTLDNALLESALDKIVEQGMLASSIVNRVRSYARGSVREESVCDLSDLLRDAASRFERIRPEASKIALRTVPALVEVNPLEIGLLIYNLFKNADEASRQSPIPNISARVETNGRFVILSVSDNGPVLSQDALARLFEPLHTTKTNGLGLGLAICRQIAEAHGGRIEAAQNAEGRLSMVLTLPLVEQCAVRADALNVKTKSTS